MACTRTCCRPRSARLLAPRSLPRRKPSWPTIPKLAQLDALAILPWLLERTFTADTAFAGTRMVRPCTRCPAYDERIAAERLAILDHRHPLSAHLQLHRAGLHRPVRPEGREQTSRTLGLAELYFLVFEEALDRYDMPMELKYLAVVESCAEPGRPFRAGATTLAVQRPATASSMVRTWTATWTSGTMWPRALVAACRYQLTCNGNLRRLGTGTGGLPTAGLAT